MLAENRKEKNAWRRSLLYGQTAWTAVEQSPHSVACSFRIFRIKFANCEAVESYIFLRASVCLSVRHTMVLYQNG